MVFKPDSFPVVNCHCREFCHFAEKIARFCQKIEDENEKMAAQLSYIYSIKCHLNMKFTKRLWLCPQKIGNYFGKLQTSTGATRTSRL